MKFTHLICSIMGIFALSFGPLAPSAKAQCLGDVNNSGVVDGADLATILSAWGTDGCMLGADINHDGTVNGVDLSFVLAGWGLCSNPAWATVLEWVPDPVVVTDVDFRARIIATGLPWRVRDNGTGIEMLLVPPGTFAMGASPSDSEAYFGETPVHQVTLTNAFYLGRTEVTQAVWVATMGTNPSQFVGVNNPVDRVTWNDCQSFCTATGMRLPTEAEWEYACRSGTLTARYGVLNNVAWHLDNSGNTTHVVGGKLPNALGFYDMLGNVWEWNQDWHGPYTVASVLDPVGPAIGSYRVLRGGSWGSYSFICRASNRNSGPSNYVYDRYGFRAARNP